MAVDLTVNLVQGRLRRALKKAPVEVFEETHRAFNEYLRDFQRRFIRFRLSKSGDPRTMKDPRKGLFRHTGSLARGFEVKVSGDSIKTLEGRLGWFDPFGAMVATTHEKGATIRGRPWLTIPLRAAMTPAGVVRGPARSFPNTFIIRSRGGNLLIMQSRGTGAVPLFLLKRKVEIPARLELGETFESSTEVQKRLRRINRGLTKAMARAQGGG